MKLNSSIRLLAVSLIVLLAGCGGGGGDGGAPMPEKGVFSGFPFDLDWQLAGGTDGTGPGDGGDGGGGAGAGGALGQFRNALVVVKYPDGSEVGRAVTDNDRGMVTVRPGRDYGGPLLIEIHGQPGAQYFEEGKNTYVPFETGRLLRAFVPTVSKNIGVTPFTEAAYQLAMACKNGQVADPAICEPPEGVRIYPEPQNNTTFPTMRQIIAANERVRSLLNGRFPSTLQIDDVTRLPFIVNDATTQGQIATTPRGRYGLVNVAFSKQAAMYNTASTSPTLLGVEQLSADLLDGRLDGMNHDAPSVPAERRTYDPATLTTELSSALAQQTGRYGNSEALSTLPRIVAYANTRYDSYYFDARILPGGEAHTVAVATESPGGTRTPGQVTTYVAPSGENRAFMVYGNMGSGSLFIKTDSADSAYSIVAVGDNTNGELGDGSRDPTTASARQINLPGVLTHIAGGFGHTVARFADGSVYAWGDNAYGQLGQGVTGSSLPRSATPLPVSLPGRALSVAATNVASFALLENGTVYAWGSAWGFGSLGNNTENGVATSPVQVLSAEGPLTGVVQISARDNDVIVLKRDGSVWTWGSFPAATGAAGAPVGFRGGRNVATRVTGLPDGAMPRKVLTEQSLFNVLMDDGAVYSFGVYYDITAQTVLYDVTPKRVLNLPDARDLMPGGFLGYGERPSDRMTAMVIDFNGKLWRVRGQVAERFDPANPTAQHRPKGQSPRVDCASCHNVPPKDPPPPPPTSGPVCVLPGFKLGTNGMPVLVNSESVCESCHNGSLLGNGQPLAPLTCVPPNLPPPQPPSQAPVLSGSCSLPTGHVATPPGTVCATCHNSIIARPLTCLADPGNPPGPAINTVTVITAIIDDVTPVTGAIGQGQATNDATPTVQGSISAALSGDQVVRVFRNGAGAGTAMVSGTSWTYQSPTLADGTYTFSARVESVSGGAGSSSAGRTIIVSTAAAGVQITSVEDNQADSLGLGRGLGPIANGGVTNDPTPQVRGALVRTLGSGESLRVRRGGVTFPATVAGTNWTANDPGALSTGSHSYVAELVAGAQVVASSAPYSVVFDNTPPAGTTSIAITVDSPFSTRLHLSGAAGTGESDATPRIFATINSPPSDALIQIFRNGQPVGQPMVPGPFDGPILAVSITDSTGLNLGAVGQPPQSSGLPSDFAYTARLVDAAGNFGSVSATRNLRIDLFNCLSLFQWLGDAGTHPTQHTRVPAVEGSCSGACHTKDASRMLVPGNPGGRYWCTFSGGLTTP